MKYATRKADAVWGAAIHAAGRCAVGVGCSGSLEAHHLIRRSVTATRHAVENGIFFARFITDTPSFHPTPGRKRLVNGWKKTCPTVGRGCRNINTKGIKMKLPQIDGITVHCAHSAIVPVDDLKPYPRNNKTHPEAQIALMCKAIKAQGWRAPVTVSNQSGYIVRGHGRLEAAKRLGLKSVPVDFQNYASTAAEQADRIADNKLAELAEWDLPALKEELLELDTGDLDMDITGFDAGALEGLMTACPPEENEPDNTGPKMPFGLRYGPRLVRRKGHATMAACLYGGEQNIVDAVKSWKENGKNGDATSAEAANAIVEMIKECGLRFASVTTPQRHHEGFHGATSIANCAAKIMGVPFVDIFGFCKESKGHHPARNSKRKALQAKKPAAKLSPVLCVDDIATSGETLRAACETIRGKGLCATAACLVHYWPQ